VRGFLAAGGLSPRPLRDVDKKRILEYYIWLVGAAGVATVAYCVYHVPVAQLDLKFAILAVLTVFFSARFAISIPNYSGHLTISDTFIFLIMLSYGGEAAVFVAAAEGVYTSLPYRQRPRAIVFNGSIMAISTFLSATTLKLFSDPITKLPASENLPVFVAAICVMAVVQYVMNSGLAAIYTALRRGHSVGYTWSKYYLWSSITYLAGASAAGIVSRLALRFGFYYVLLTTPIILIIYLTYRTYLQNIAASASQAEQAERERMREQYAQMEKLSALGELASGVAHNFNNTLTGILARAQLLSEATDPREIKRGLRIIIQTAEDGAKTVKRIQDFARQRRDQDFVPIDVDQLMLEVAEITRPRWKDRAEAENVHIKLVRQISSNAVIMGDAGELREVLVNMVFNAVDAMPQGGTITLSTQEAGGEVEIRVADTGTGMGEEVRSRIFDPFFTTKGNAGMGLGLSVSYGIIRRHEGTVEVDSEVGRGTTFRLRFKTAGEGALPAKSSLPTPLPAHSEGGLRILVVDDEDYVRELLSDILTREGCEVALAAEGREALRLFESSAFDAVFTDVGLPGMSGWELSRAVRERDKDIPLAVITGWGDTVSPEEQTEAQADWVIPKPFSVERIAGLVHEISQRKSRQGLYAVRDAS
jgi:signal transduction histidine kinase/ActR/RegA family two-component response regulator